MPETTPAPEFGLNRFDFRSPLSFAEDVARAESLGWDAALIPSSPLLVHDPYVCLALAAGKTRRIRLGTLIENPVMRHPAVMAGSIASVDSLAPGRTLLGYGVGDTAVRLVGRSPATVQRLEESTVLTRRLLAGEAVELGAARPARLRHARPVAVWIATAGPRTLRMAGRVADGVFLRVGCHPVNLRRAVDTVRAGAREAGRDPDSVALGAVFHTVWNDDPDLALTLGRAIAAGFYEYTPGLFHHLELPWQGPPIAELKGQVWPDFHHARDLVAAGRLVGFLSEEAVRAFALYGSPGEITQQLQEVLGLGLPLDVVIPHPVLAPPRDAATREPDYVESFATRVMARIRAA